MRPESHVALVTGSTERIDCAMAERFAAEGANVPVTGRSEFEGEQVGPGDSSVWRGGRICAHRCKSGAGCSRGGGGGLDLVLDRCSHSD